MVYVYVIVCVCTVGVVGLGCGLKPPKRAAGTAVVAMADCSAAGSTEWLTERSYMAAWVTWWQRERGGVVSVTSSVGAGVVIVVQYGCG